MVRSAASIDVDTTPPTAAESIRQLRLRLRHRHHRLCAHPRRDEPVVYRPCRPVVRPTDRLGPPRRRGPSPGRPQRSELTVFGSTEQRTPRAFTLVWDESVHLDNRRVGTTITVHRGRACEADTRARTHLPGDSYERWAHPAVGKPATAYVCCRARAASIVPNRWRFLGHGCQKSCDRSVFAFHGLAVFVGGWW